MTSRSTTVEEGARSFFSYRPKKYAFEIEMAHGGAFYVYVRGVDRRDRVIIEPLLVSWLDETGRHGWVLE